LALSEGGGFSDNSLSANLGVVTGSQHGFMSFGDFDSLVVSALDETELFGGFLDGEVEVFEDEVLLFPFLDDSKLFSNEKVESFVFGGEERELALEFVDEDFIRSDLTFQFVDSDSKDIDFSESFGKDGVESFVFRAQESELALEVTDGVFKRLNGDFVSLDDTFQFVDSDSKSIDFSESLARILLILSFSEARRASLPLRSPTVCSREWMVTS